MKKQFVTYEIALAVKELGFNEECLACYTPHLGNGIFELISKGSSNEKSAFNERFIKANAINGCSAPLWQQVIDWLNKEYDIKFSFPYWTNSDKLPECMRDKYDCAIFVTDGKAIPVKNNKMDSYYFNELYEMREQAILKAIKIINENMVE